MTTIYVPDQHGKLQDEQYNIEITDKINEALGMYHDILENVKIERAVTVILFNVQNAILTFIPDEDKRPIFHIGRVGYKKLVPLQWVAEPGKPWRIPDGHPALDTEGASEEMVSFAQSLAFTAFASYVGKPNEYTEEKRVKEALQKRMRKAGAYIGSRAVVVDLDKPVRRREPTGSTDTGIKKCHHECKGHWRTLKSGKVVWVKSHWRGDKALGMVHKEYTTTLMKEATQ